MIEHPYIRYAQALLMEENNLDSVDEIKLTHINREITKGLDAFRMQPIRGFVGKENVEYGFKRLEKGDTKNGVYLSPNSISTDMQAKNLWKAAIDYLNNSTCDLTKITNLSMSQVPIAGEFLAFSESGTIGRGNPKSSIAEQGFGIISTLTLLKPCLQYKIGKKGKTEMFNVCIIPDLPLDKMRDFIFVFKRMRDQQLGSELFIGKVVEEKNKKGEKTGHYSPKRPTIYNGNFLNPPKSSALGSVALLAAIGEFARQSEVSNKAMHVLDSLKKTTIYLIKYGGATTFTYNHYVVDLAKEGKLREVIDCLYYSKLYNQESRRNDNIEYQKFDLFTSRFLQLFTPASFKDFLSSRAEYPEGVRILLNTYFIKMEKINSEIVVSARQLGKWLNLVAFLVAQSEVKTSQEEKRKYWEDIRKVKAKVLVELESTTFAAKTGDALVAQIVTRAGRLSGMDAPESAALYMEKTMSGELPLDSAKNLLIAFSRLINKKQTVEQPKEISLELGEGEGDFSNE